MAGAQLSSLGGAEASAGKALSKPQRLERAKLGEAVAVRATGRGNPWINMADGRDLLTDYNGAVEVAAHMESEKMVPLSLASGDFDEDGMPDLVSAYATENGGILTIHRGNIDSVYPDTPQARARKADGTFTDAPFLSPGLVFDMSAAPELIEVGDFNADGHFDIAAAAHSSSAVHLMTGDGSGSVREAETIALPGNVTALASGDVNRADGIADLIVAVDGAAGPMLMVFEGPEGAVKSEPEIFDLPSRANAITTGHLGRDYTTDIAVGAGRDLLIIHGRDRKLSLDEAARAEVAGAAISRRSFESGLSSLAAGDFTGDTRLELAVLTEDGSLLLVEEKEEKTSLRHAGEQHGRWSIKTLTAGAARGRILRARVSSLSHENILVVDGAGRGIHVWMDEAELRERGDGTLSAASVSGTGAAALLEVEGEPVAVLPMRLNMDGLSDLVILRSGTSSPTVTLTAPNSTITVCNTSDCGSIGCGSLRAAMTQANQSPGADMIAFSGSFSGVPTIQVPGQNLLPAITEAVTIS
ncbi:MAG TPA: VCBS repeat-containing protein, partial [Blastocatellia bacterium]|nr:VCBS repeat-containing protein [Blastocatellia bacterium]